jgi:hypothetical protein
VLDHPRTPYRQSRFFISNIDDVHISSGSTVFFDARSEWRRPVARRVAEDGCATIDRSFKPRAQNSRGGQLLRKPTLGQ